MILYNINKKEVHKRVIAWGTDCYLDDSLFYNRKKDLKFLEDILDSSQYGSTPTILLTGVRGVGKTALINKIKNDFKDDYLVIYMDLSLSDEYQQGEFTRQSFMEQLFKEIIKACNEFALITTIDKKIEKYFKTHDIKLIKEIKSYEDTPIPIPWLEDNYSKLANFVINLPQRIYEEYEDVLKGVFIFFDEFQIIKELDNYNKFLWYLRGIILSQNNVAYMISGSMSLKDSLIEDIAGKQGAFGGRMLSVEILPFSFETTKKYLQERADFLNFTDDGYERFYKYTKGIPFYVNTLARLMSTDKLLTEEIVIDEFYRSLPYLSMHLKSVWDKLNYHEQKIIVQLINGPIRCVDIANNLNITPGTLSKPLSKLQDLALVEITDNGKYQIVDSILGTWLKNEYENKGVYPYR